MLDFKLVPLGIGGGLFLESAVASKSVHLCFTFVVGVARRERREGPRRTGICVIKKRN